MTSTRRRIGIHTALSVACAAAVTLSAPAAAAPAAAAPAAAAPAATATVGPAQAVTVGRPLRIMPLGDSITMGIGSRTMSSYRSDLYRRLTSAGLAVDFVGSAHDGIGPDTDHEGHSGWTIDKISRAVDEWLDRSAPDVVLLHIGTNDMRQDATAVSAAGRLSLLIDQIRFQVPAAQIFVAKLTGAKRDAEQRRIDAYNAQMPGIVAGKDPRVHLVDQSAVDGLSIRDNLHPNEFGFAKMSYTWYNALKRVLRPAGAAAWPAGVNPYRQSRANLCLLEATYPDGRFTPVIRCDWWHRAVVTRRSDGHLTTVTRWVRE